MFNIETFSSRLRQLRKAQNVSQSILAEHLSVSYHQVCKMETAHRSPSVEVLCALADYFNVSIDYLVGRSDNPQRP